VEIVAQLIEQHFCIFDFVVQTIERLLFNRLNNTSPFLLTFVVQTIE